MQEFVSETLTEKVTPAEKPWMKHFGKLAHLHEETVRINKLIEEEFGQIEPEDLE